MYPLMNQCQQLQLEALAQLPCKINDMEKVIFCLIQVTGNTTTTSLQRDKNTRLDPNDTVRTSSFM